jgi:hypothetical protein
MGFKSVERQILEEVVDRALAKGWCIDVNDGEETTVTKSKDRAQILEACQSTDADTLTFHEAKLGQGWVRVGWVWLIYGNGDALISDYSASDAMDAFIGPISEEIEAAF